MARKTKKVPVPDSCDTSKSVLQFVKRTAAKSGLGPQLVNTVFGYIQQQMLEDLLVNNEPIDLGFGWLIAIPYRPNWKDALAVDADYNLETMRQNRPAMYRRLTSLTLSGVRVVGKEPDSSPHHGFHWVMEVIPKSLWHRSVAEVEFKTRIQGGEAHVRNWARIIWDLRPQIQQALEEYSAGCTLKVGTIARDENRTGTREFLKLRPYSKSELIRRNGQDSSEPIVWGDGSPPVWNPEGDLLTAGFTSGRTPGSPLDLKRARNKDLVDIIPPKPDALINGFPSGDPVRPVDEEGYVPEPDPDPATVGSGDQANVDNDYPSAWADD